MAHRLSGAPLVSIPSIALFLVVTPRKAPDEWPSEWFYIEDVALLDPIQKGLPEFAHVPLKKRHSWRPRSLEEEDGVEVRQLMSRIKELT